MTVVILPIQTTDQLDIALIPYDIYNQTINKQTKEIETYFIKNPKLLMSFVGYNSALKLANQLAYNKKCGCFYKLPWLCNYAQENNIQGAAMSFSQQVQEYDYMIKYWNPNPKISYMQYLSQIALGMILDIKQFRYYQSNNLSSCTIFQKPYYKNNFSNEKSFILYINRNFSNF